MKCWNQCTHQAAEHGRSAAGSPLWSYILTFWTGTLFSSLDTDSQDKVNELMKWWTWAFILHFFLVQGCLGLIKHQYTKLVVYQKALQGPAPHGASSCLLIAPSSLSCLRVNEQVLSAVEPSTDISLVSTVLSYHIHLTFIWFGCCQLLFVMIYLFPVYHFSLLRRILQDFVTLLYKVLYN